MATETASSIIRAALISDINLTADQLIEKVNEAGIKASPQTIKNLSYNIRPKLRKKNPAKPAKPVKAAARQTPKPKPALSTPTEAPISTPEPSTNAAPSAPIATPAADAPNVSSVLANVALVNKLVGLVGGLENVRQVVDAVKACGGVEAFLEHLQLVAGIRGGEA